VVLDGGGFEGIAVQASGAMPPVNTPDNTFSGRSRWPGGTALKVNAEGEFVGEGMNPGEYTVVASAPGHVTTSKRVTLKAGVRNDLETIRMNRADLAFYLPGVEPKAGPLAWEKDYAAALERSQREKRPMMVMMTATWCGPCKMLEEQTFTDPWVREFLTPFVVVKAYEDREVEKRYGLEGYPTLVFVAPDGTVAYKRVGFLPAYSFAGVCAKALHELKLPYPDSLKTLIDRGVVRAD